MRVFGWAALAMMGAVSTMSAQSFGPQPDAATKTELLALRERAWRTYLSNDQAGFQQVVPGELLAMGWDGGTWSDRAATLRQMTELAGAGQTIAALHFPRTEFQQYGDVVIFYTTFHLALKGKDGTVSETSGRGTEVFVRKNGQWTHTAWHLDRIPPA